LASGTSALFSSRCRPSSSTAPPTPARSSQRDSQACSRLARPRLSWATGASAARSEKLAGAGPGPAAAAAVEVECLAAGGTGVVPLDCFCLGGFEVCLAGRCCCCCVGALASGLLT
jgi:hypothetical protein